MGGDERASGPFADAADSPWGEIWVYDHFHTTPVPSAKPRATHEAWSLMSAQRLSRPHGVCTCMSYRNPAYLAKVTASVDVISGGRVEMGIGGG